MLKIKDLLKENSTYKLFLLTLQEEFNKTINETNYIEIKKYLRSVNVAIDEVLDIKNNKKSFEDLVEKVKEMNKI